LIGNRDNFTGGIGEISYNYIEGARVAIEYNLSAAGAPTSGSLLIAHNTIDNTWTSTTSYYGANILTPSYNTQGIGIYDPAGHGLNSAAITIRDNIIVNTRWYGTHYNGDAAGVLSGNLSIANSIYWNNYWDAAASGESPVHYANEWSGTVTNPQIAWQGGADGGSITPNATTKTLDPLFVGGAKTAQSSYYALRLGSPACAAATDGGNIGAWQSAPSACLQITHTLTYTAGANGSIIGASPQTVNSGASGTLVTATPATGYHFVSWSDSYPTAARIDTNVTANISVSANFADITVPSTPETPSVTSTPAATTNGPAAAVAGAPALFDITSESVPTQQNIILLVVLCAISGILLTLFLTYLVMRNKARLVAKKIHRI
jgi:hypothetical protein